MMTVGLMELRLTLDKLTPQLVGGLLTKYNVAVERLSIGANYIDSEDYISIEFACIDCGLDPKDDAVCEMIVNYVRNSDSYGAEQDQRAIAFTGPFFQHTVGIDMYSLTKALAAKMSILVSIIDSSGGHLMCTAPLVGTGYSVHR
jgi:hypothetical protein